MHLIRQALADRPADRQRVRILVDRHTLGRRLWRATAEDGTDFGFELAEPLRHGDAVFDTGEKLYVIDQAPEPVLRIPIGPTAEAAAIVGWAVGNMHFTIQACGDHITAPDDPGLRQMLDRIGRPYTTDEAVFEPHRFAAVVGHTHGHAEDAAHPFIRPAAHSHRHAHDHVHG